MSVASFCIRWHNAASDWQCALERAPVHLRQQVLRHAVVQVEDGRILQGARGGGGHDAVDDLQAASPVSHFSWTNHDTVTQTLFAISAASSTPPFLVRQTRRGGGSAGRAGGRPRRRGAGRRRARVGRRKGLRDRNRSARMAGACPGREFDTFSLTPLSGRFRPLSVWRDLRATRPRVTLAASGRSSVGGSKWPGQRPCAVLNVLSQDIHHGALASRPRFGRRSRLGSGLIVDGTFWIPE
jgi:hypothetical protein